MKREKIIMSSLYIYGRQIRKNDKGHIPEKEGGEQVRWVPMKRLEEDEDDEKAFHLRNDESCRVAPAEAIFGGREKANREGG